VQNLWTAASDGDLARVDSLMALEGFTPSSQETKRGERSLGIHPKKCENMLKMDDFSGFNWFSHNLLMGFNHFEPFFILCRYFWQFRTGFNHFDPD
jgi:hypothetical protein